MRRLVHLSDLHFGRTHPELLAPLLRTVRGLEPDLVAISGDLTQRAREWQFREARDFIDRLECPTLCVPGNHDVPLDNIVFRLLRPWGRYRRWISRDLEPRHSDPNVLVLGVNTVDPFSWQRGLMNARSIERATARLRAQAGAQLRVVVAHHPFEQEPGERKSLMRGASRALDALAANGADIVLSGHLHAWRAGPFAAEKASGVLHIQAGTGLSTRLRGEENDFNLLTFAPGLVTVRRYATAAGAHDFSVAETAEFLRAPEGWTHADSTPEAPGPPA